MEAIPPAKTLVEKSYDALLDAICAGDLKPGDRISQDDIAERLNVSRQPINTALAMLKSQKFVVDTGRRGVVVAPVDPHMFDSIYQFRSVVEPLAVELATERLTSAALNRGRQIIKHGEAKARAGTVAEIIQADVDFHSFIWEWSGNEIIADALALNWRHLRRAMGEILSMQGASTQVWAEHKAIFKAMTAGDGAKAAELMHAHILEAPARLGR